MLIYHILKNNVLGQRIKPILYNLSSNYFHAQFLASVCHLYINRDDNYQLQVQISLS